ncbi:MAG: hypothetical protein MUE90_04610, partial [Thermoanaerobaculales bacterium]|nr:hypothetical protein [Thermoanaerobaculales bacterium]
MRRRLFRRLLAGLAAVLVTCAGVAVLVHLPAVQERAWRRTAAAVEASTGWRPAAESVQLRAFPARLVVRGLTLSVGDRPALAVERLEARWSWPRLLRSPHRLESLEIEGPAVDAAALPSRGEPTEDRVGADLLGSFEVGSLRIERGRAVGGFADLGLELEGITLEAGLSAGRAVLEGEIGKLAVSRDSRLLELGSARLRAGARRDEVAIESLALTGGAAFAEATGTVRTEPGPDGRLELRLGGDLAALAGWWDPNLASGFQPEG